MGMATFAVETSEEQPITFNESLHWFRKMNHKDVWILDKLELVGDYRDVIRSIQDRTVCATSNGSFAESRGAAGFMIACHDNHSV
jgi:hypothetical protein